MLPAAAATTTAYTFSHHAHHHVHQHHHYRNHSNHHLLHHHHVHVTTGATSPASTENGVGGKSGTHVPTSCPLVVDPPRHHHHHRAASVNSGGSGGGSAGSSATVLRHHPPWTIAFFSASLDGPQKEAVQVNWRRTGRRYTQKYRQQRPRSPIKSEGGFLVPQREPTAFAPSLQTRIGYVDDEDPISESYDLPGYTELLVTNGHDESVGLVAIRMKPDEQGRFGFNVKGGADQNMPIIVSRVAPHTPADHSVPRLNEGDQVLCINGRDVSGLSHEQVVQLIRASRDLPTKELVLTVKPNVYVAEETEEPPFQYVPDVPHISQTRVPEVDALSESILLLSEGLDSGAVIAQFEQLYRKKPNMTLNIAKLPENMFKNRYRDISPYDSTRVILHGGATGDYINASHVNMEIPSSGIVNRYIAAQGPLPTTCSDFWQMVWEQQSTLIVMLTTVLERGRVKCHQYWPDLYSSMDCGLLHITCHKEQEGPSFAFREFTLISSETNEERHITHMQYIAWPDHGVPDESSDFLEFVQRVRQNRIGMVEATLVHCSAGIGRTGVLILMETAICLIEANEPVYPLDIVRNMRDQRAMLIQNASQYKFVCEAILKVYNEKIVKPLPEYHR